MQQKEKDKRVILLMISIYCKAQHHTNDLCENCKTILEYSYKKIDNCPLGNKKVTCKKCKIHCYSKEQKEEVRKIMKYSGPRMIIYHPIIAIKHLLKEIL